MKISSSWVARIGHLSYRVYALVEQLGRGNSRYFFIVVTPGREDDLRAALQGTARIRLTDFGRIIATGRGGPPREVMDAIAAGRSPLP
ncbi:MAG: hypothetical protein IT567_03450 [Alphaproteobacteria bacterium]|nr:hypothetical protein [Alphaproteobacteria bacterium]